MKRFKKCSLNFLLIILTMGWGNIIYAQTNYDTSNVEIIEAPIEDTTVDVVEKNNDYLTGQFKNIDSLEIIPIVKGITSLQDTITKLKNEEAYWYADGVNIKKPTTEKSENGFWYWLTQFFNTRWPRIIAWIIVIGIATTLIVLFIKSNGIGLFAPTSKKIDDANLGEAIGENIFEIDFEKSIEQSIHLQNYKLATRLLFLRLLKTMAEKNLIVYSPSKTNFDYLMELNSSNSFNSFAKAIRNYEYVWFGNFLVNSSQFDIIKTSFDKLYTQLTNS